MEYVVVRSGARLALFHGAKAAAPAPTVLFVHATGFCSQIWNGVIKRMTSPCSVACMDMQGHGLSDVPVSPVSWAEHAEDVASVAASLRGPLIAVGHSAGAYAAMRAVAAHPSLFSACVLLDPVLMPLPLYDLPSIFGGRHFAAKRRQFWESPDALFERLAPRPPYSRWDRDVLRDYCVHGLVPRRDGRVTAPECAYTLACEPRVEADTYDMSTAPCARAHELVAGMADAVPTHLVRAPSMLAVAGSGGTAGKFDMSLSPTDPGLGGVLGKACVETVAEDLDHFIPMRDPARVARWVDEMVEASLGGAVGSSARL